MARHKWKLLSIYLVVLFSGSFASWWQVSGHEIAGPLLFASFTTAVVALFGIMLITALTE